MTLWTQLSGGGDKRRKGPLRKIPSRHFKIFVPLYPCFCMFLQIDRKCLSDLNSKTTSKSSQMMSEHTYMLYTSSLIALFKIPKAIIFALFYCGQILILVCRSTQWFLKTFQNIHFMYFFMEKQGTSAGPQKADVTTR